jgi:hypothetical protein
LPVFLFRLVPFGHLGFFDFVLVFDLDDDDDDDELFDFGLVFAFAFAFSEDDDKLFDFAFLGSGDIARISSLGGEREDIGLISSFLKEEGEKGGGKREERGGEIGLGFTGFNDSIIGSISRLYLS